MIRRGIKSLLHTGAIVATLLCIAALILRVVIKDSGGLFILYYATPWPVLAVGTAICARHWFFHGRRFAAALLTVASLVSAFCWFALDWQWRAQAQAHGQLRIVHWNVDRPDLRQEGVMRWLREQDADIIAIAERQPRKKDTSARWLAAFPDYRQIIQRGETLCLVRGQVLSTRKELRYEGSYGTVMRIRVRGREMTLAQMDIFGSPLVSRKEAFEKVAELIVRHRGETMLMLGDFNTPLDSVHLAPLRAELKNAFETVGRGCAATWPMPLPVLSLDQVWVSDGFRPVRCEHVGSWRSDHRAVVTELDFTR